MLAPGTDWHIFVSNYLQFVAKVFNSLSPLRLPWPGQVPAPLPPSAPGCCRGAGGQLVTAGGVWSAFLPSAPLQHLHHHRHLHRAPVMDAACLLMSCFRQQMLQITVCRGPCQKYRCDYFGHVSTAISYCES